MNASGVIRGYLSKIKTGEEFLKLVSTTIEKELQEWDKQYKVSVLNLRNYELLVHKEEKWYQVTISEEELNELQNSSPFSLDKKIWNELRKQGLHFKKGTGDYLLKVYL